MTTDRQSDKTVVLTIAGFDPSGGAGVIADVKTLIAFNCIPSAAITSLTFQNSAGVFGAIHQTAESLRSQILPVAEEFRIRAVKIGMLPTREIVLEVARLLREAKMPSPVVDPVLCSSSGYELMEPAAREAWLTELMPLARLITPNIPEAETFTGMAIAKESDMYEAASKLRELGARAVLIKGGHLQPRSALADQDSKRDPVQAIDLLDDEGRITVFRGEWIDAPPVRGTGCMLSSAIAGCLGKGMKLEAAVDAAKDFVTEALEQAASAAPIESSKLKT